MRPRLEVADVVRAHGESYRRAHGLTPAQETVLRHLLTCRCAALGGHADECVQCGHVRVSYNSCRDRHCPKCQALRREVWLAERQQRLLPVEHFHVVFTLPSELRGLVLGNRQLLYGLLFQAAWETLDQLAREPSHLGGQLGVTAVLHTWGQTLTLHPHLHCVVSGGGLSADGQRWVAGRQGYLLPVKALGRLFRGKYLAKLHRVWKTGGLRLGGSTADLADSIAWSALKDRLYNTPWVVYAKRSFGGVRQVMAYLGRYTHRVAITNHRLEALRDDRVTFQWKDYADGSRSKSMTLEATEFLRRFLLHQLPKGFTRIRHYGLYASSNVRGRLEQARALLAPSPRPLPDPPAQGQTAPWWERFARLTGIDVMRCPACGGSMSLKCPLPAPIVQPRGPP